MRVLAIDPGYDRVGVAIVGKAPDHQEEVIFSTCLKSPKAAPVSERIHMVCKDLSEIIQHHSPTHLAIETLFFNKNVKTAIAVAEARGAIRLTAQLANLKVVELSPQEIKVAMTGYGRSDKQSIHDMVSRLVKNAPTTALDDEYDAIAIGVTCLAQYGRDSKIPKR